MRELGGSYGKWRDPENEIKKINSWLKNKIHQYGGSKTPKELLLEVTGEEFNPKYYIQFLKEKYGKLYL